MNIFRRFTTQIDTENPFALEMLHQDTHELDMQKAKRDRGVAILGLFLLLGISTSGNLYQIRQAKEFHHFIMVDRDFEPVDAIARRADIMADSDPIKEGITAKFLKEYVTWWRERMMDEDYLTTKLNQARRQVGGTVMKAKLQAELDKDPWKDLKKERVIVNIPEGTPVRVSKGEGAKTWLVNWTETVKDITGVVLRVENKGGHFLIAEDPKRVSTDNPFGLVVVDQEYK